MFLSLHIVVIGKVQNVFLRDTVSKYAQENNLFGDIRNLKEINKVEIHIEGEEKPINQFIDWLKSNPGSIKIEELEILKKQKVDKLEYNNFQISY